jgi:CO dehydrogenase nickel-insertion accessory protein CooC1
LLGQLERTDEFVIADLEAGVGNLNRMAANSVDTLFVIVEATPKSIEVAQRVVGIAAERQVAPVRVIANKIRSADDLRMIRAALGPDLVEVPEEPAVLAADRDGRSVYDTAPVGAAVSVLARLARVLSSGTSMEVA